MRKETSPYVDSVNREILRKGKNAIKDFDSSQEVRIEPKKLTSKLISIRLPKEMIVNLRKIATARGDVGYQQIIKSYIAEGLIRDNQMIRCNIPGHQVFWVSNISETSSSSSYDIPTKESSIGTELTFK